MLEKDIPYRNMFMVLNQINYDSLSDVPKGYHIRCIRHDELDIWMGFHSDTDEERLQSVPYMKEYFNRVYAPTGERFFSVCKFLCDDKTDTPIATAFLWRAYGSVNTVHWVKTKKEYEGRGFGRAIMSAVIREADELPVCLHTQPSSYRAVGLYSSLGFSFITDDYIGIRENHLKECLSILKEFMIPELYDNLKFTSAPKQLIEAAETTEYSQF